MHLKSIQAFDNYQSYNKNIVFIYLSIVGMQYIISGCTIKLCDIVITTLSLVIICHQANLSQSKHTILNVSKPLYKHNSYIFEELD